MTGPTKVQCQCGGWYEAYSALGTQYLVCPLCGDSYTTTALVDFGEAIKAPDVGERIEIPAVRYGGPEKEGAPEKGAAPEKTMNEVEKTVIHEFVNPVDFGGESVEMARPYVGDVGCGSDLPGVPAEGIDLADGVDGAICFKRAVIVSEFEINDVEVSLTISRAPEKAPEISVRVKDGAHTFSADGSEARIPTMKWLISRLCLLEMDYAQELIDFALENAEKFCEYEDENAMRLSIEYAEENGEVY